jgi:hypothetical protein
MIVLYRLQAKKISKPQLLAYSGISFLKDSIYCDQNDGQRDFFPEYYIGALGVRCSFHGCICHTTHSTHFNIYIDVPIAHKLLCKWTFERNALESR